MSRILLSENSKETFAEALGNMLVDQPQTTRFINDNFEITWPPPGQDLSEGFFEHLIEYFEENGRILQLITAAKADQTNQAVFDFKPVIQKDDGFFREGYAHEELNCFATLECEFSNPEFDPIPELFSVLNSDTIEFDSVKAAYNDVFRDLKRSFVDGIQRTIPANLSKLHFAWEMAGIGLSALGDFVSRLAKTTSAELTQREISELLSKYWPERENEAQGICSRLQLYFDFAQGNQASNGKSALFHVWNRFWRSTASQPEQLSDDEVIEVSRIGEYLTKVFNRFNENLYEPVVEIFVPQSILNWGVDLWDWEDFQEIRRTIGKDNPVVVRPYFPINPKIKDHVKRIKRGVAEFKNRWSKIQNIASFTPNVEIKGPACFCGEPTDPDDFRNSLSNEEDLGCLVFEKHLCANSKMPVHIKHIFSVGVPIIVWARTEEAAVELKSVAAKILDTSVDDIPRRALQVRKKKGEFVTNMLHKELTLVREDGECRVPKPRPKLRAPK